MIYQFALPSASTRDLPPTHTILSLAFPTQSTIHSYIMSSSTTNTTLTRGTYAPSTPTCLRSPCPMINSLANHGYLPRDGRSVRLSDVKTALRDGAGLSPALITVFARPIFEESKASQPPRSLLQNVTHFVLNPWAALGAGMRKPGQTDSAGERVFNLDELDAPGVVEHDISLSRRDHQQGDNHTPQADLIKGLLESSTDGGKVLTIEDLARYRRLRISEQRKANAEVVYGKSEHARACAEIGLLLGVFGKGKEGVKVEFLRAFFGEERLPVEEGWKARDGSWFGGLGIAELIGKGVGVWRTIGMKFEEGVR